MVIRQYRMFPCFLLLGFMFNVSSRAMAEDENDYYRIIPIATATTNTDSRSTAWRPSDDGVALEVSGIAPIDETRIAVAIRKGEIWILDGVYGGPDAEVTYQRFAKSLHEPLGLIKRGDALVTAQRTELTLLRDTDGDDEADDYESLAAGWGVSGCYHEYAYGPKVDGDGKLWLTLNIGMGLTPDQQARTLPARVLGYSQAKWRGWGLRLDNRGLLTPICAGMRSPSGLGANAEGDMFYTDQQGNWVATNSLHHMRSGAFFHHPESLASMNESGSTIRNVTNVPNGVPIAAALKKFPQMRPPAVWFPYKKMGQSATDIMLDRSGGAFGPFAGQLFVGEFTQASINRVFLEKVDGEYQGACFPFRRGFASAVLRMTLGVNGTVFVGLTNRGWSSLGTASYGLERLQWTGETPFEIHSMKAKPDGFELTFTKPVDVTTANRITAYRIKSYTYLYHSAYGSDEIQQRELRISKSVVSNDGLRVRLFVDDLRETFVHELDAGGVRDVGGRPLLHRHAYYTLNRIPKSK